MGVATVAERKVSLEAEHLEDIRLAASKMTGARRRAFQAEMALKYCSGSARRAEDVFGWSRQAVQLGLHEKRTGIICLGLHAFRCGAKFLKRMVKFADHIGNPLLPKWDILIQPT